MGLIEYHYLAEYIKKKEAILNRKQNEIGPG